MKYSVLMTDTIFSDNRVEQEVFEKEGINFQLSPSVESSILGNLAKNADALLVVYADVNAQLIEGLDRCKIIVRAGIGYNNVDIDAAAKKGITVANVPDYCHDEVADHTFGIFLTLVRKVSQLNVQVRDGLWDANLGKDVPQLRGRKFGLLGCGAIGQQVALRAKAFGLDVVGYDPYMAEERFLQNGITQIKDLDKFLNDVDYLSLHVPLTAETQHIINASALSKMKGSSIVINTSRGGLVEEEDLYNALIDETIAGAALDVLEQEPPKSVPKLSTLDNVIMTPHTAFLSAESVRVLRQKASQEIVRVLNGEEAKNRVN